MIKNDHICIFGATSSGKTYFAANMFQNMNNYNIFVNTQYEPVIIQSGAIVVNSVDELCTALEEKHNNIVYNPEYDDPVQQREEVAKIIDVLFGLGKIINSSGDRLIWCHLYIDEVHLFSSKKSPYARIDRIATQGKRHGVVGVFISQRPALVSQTLITQSDLQVIFRCNSYEIPYFERYGYPISDYQDWLNKDYHFIVDDGKTIIKMRPIKL